MWFSPLREALAAFVDETQKTVTGTVNLKLYKGNIISAGSQSPYSLYSEEFVTFGEDEVYNQKDAEGFINLFGLPLKMRAMIGKVTKEILFKGLKFPDLRAIKLLARLRNRKDDTIMLAIVEELAKDGLEVVDQTIYLKPLMPSVGVLTQRTPTEKENDDIRFGFAAAKAIGGLDIGQTVVVKNKAVMVKSEKEFIDTCMDILTNTSRAEAMKRSCIEVVMENQGATEKNLTELQKLLDEIQMRR